MEFGRQDVETGYWRLLTASEFSRKNSGINQKKASYMEAFSLYKSWQRLTLPRVTAVPSALRVLTSLFGKGRGGHPRHSHHYNLKELLKTEQLIEHSYK